MHLWVELPTSHAESFQSLLRRRVTVLKNTHLCEGRRRRTSPLSWSLEGIVQAAGAAVNQSRQHLSSGSSVMNSSQGIQLVPMTGGMSNSSSSAAQGATNNPSSGPSSISITQSDEAFVLFGVQGARRTLELAQIDAKAHCNDSSFFPALRKSYRDNRGFLRYWFSVWQLNYCDFVKVSTSSFVSCYSISVEG